MAILAIACMTLSFTSCNYKTDAVSNDLPDSVYLAEQVEAVINPSFASVDEVLIYQNNFVESSQVDEIFASMPEATLRNVAAVCLKQRTSVDKRGIVTEYRINKDIYDNLPPAEKQKEASNTEPQKSVPKVSYRTDTVDGKVVKTKITEEPADE